MGFRVCPSALPTFTWLPGQTSTKPAAAAKPQAVSALGSQTEAPSVLRPGPGPSCLPLSGRFSVSPP